MEKVNQKPSCGWGVLAEVSTGRCKVFNLANIRDEWVPVSELFDSHKAASIWITGNCEQFGGIYYLRDERLIPKSALDSAKESHIANLDICKSYEGERISSEPGWNETIGECATGVQYVCYKSGSPIGKTKHWAEGEKVKGANIPPGTAIASFRDGVYAEDHAAIFIRQLNRGLEVWDQFNNPQKPWGTRVLAFKGTDSDYSNDGDLFSVILS